MSNITLNFKWIILGLFINIIITFIFGSYLIYQQPILNIFHPIFRYGGILIYPILLSVSDKHMPYEKVFRTIVFYGLIAATFFFLVYLNPSFTEYLRPKEVSERFGSLRLGEISRFVHFAFCYFLACLVIKIEKKYLPSKWFILLGLLLTFFVNVFIGLSRIYIVGLFIVIFILAMLSNKVKFLNKTSARISLILIIGFLLSYPLILNTDFANSFNANLNEVENQSIAIRLEGINYFFQELLKTHGIGIGWVTTTDNNINNNVAIAFKRLNYSPIDYGILGIFISYGFIGLGIYILFLIKAFTMVYRIGMEGMPQQRLIAITIGIVFISQLSTPTFGDAFYWPEAAFYNGVLIFILDKTFQLLPIPISANSNPSIKLETAK